MSNTVDRELPMGKLGYAIEKENQSRMMAAGIDPRKMLNLAAENKPEFNVNVNPMTLFDALNQGNQGACAGHAGSMILTICYFLATGRIEFFSRGGCYYLAQRRSGITGDRGSTLDGVQWVLTDHGLCLEKDWPYPSRYDPSQPPGLKFPFKLVASQPTRDSELIQEALDMGLPVQDGIPWNSEVSRTLVTNYTGNNAQGGHSTTLWTKKDDNYRRINSWGSWDHDGCNENTPRALKQQVEHRHSSHVIYAPEGMIYPERTPVEV